MSRRAPAPWFDLVNPAELARLADPDLVLRPLRGLVVLDEIHVALIGAAPWESATRWPLAR